MINKLHVYTGDGKGKTTAAMGLALRSLGHGNTVLIAQFMKDGRSGELKALSVFPNAVILTTPPLPCFSFRMNEPERLRAAEAHAGFVRDLLGRLPVLNPQTVILDELCAAINSGILLPDTGEALIRAALRHAETVVTGRNAPAFLLDLADYISCMEAVRHPYRTEHLKARKGVEW